MSMLSIHHSIPPWVVLPCTCLFPSLTPDASFSPGPAPLSVSAPVMGIRTFLVTGDADCLFPSCVLYLDVTHRWLYWAWGLLWGTKQTCHLPWPHLETLLVNSPVTWDFHALWSDPWARGSSSQPRLCAVCRSQESDTTEQLNWTELWSVPFPGARLWPMGRCSMPSTRMTIPLSLIPPLPIIVLVSHSYLDSHFGPQKKQEVWFDLITRSSATGTFDFWKPSDLILLFHGSIVSAFSRGIFGPKLEWWKLWKNTYLPIYQNITHWGFIRRTVAGVKRVCLMVPIVSLTFPGSQAAMKSAKAAAFCKRVLRHSNLAQLS